MESVNAVKIGVGFLGRNYKRKQRQVTNEQRRKKREEQSKDHAQSFKVDNPSVGATQKSKTIPALLIYKQTL